MALLLYSGRVLVALTGGIGSGKSTVAELFAKHGAVVIKADDLAREVVSPTGRAFNEVVEHFGKDILDASGQVDRQKLADLVFSDSAKLSELENITHPAVQAELASRMANLDPTKIVIYELPLLIEKDLFNKFDKTIAVISNLGLRRERTVKRGLTETDFDARVRRQTTDENRIALTDLVIYNNGSLADLAQEVDRAWQQLTA